MPVKNTVVYVDDDPDDQFLFRECFTAVSPLNLLMFDGGTSFIAYLKTNPEDIFLIFLDVGLPGQNGVELYQRLRRDFPLIESQVVFLTTATDSDIVKAMLLENYKVVEKPSIFIKLKDVIDDCLKAGSE